MHEVTRMRRELRRLHKYQGGWVQVILFIVSLIISIALAPKPQSPRAAALEDFDVPVAEEDRAVPVLFGRKRITGANVTWYGDLDVQKIKKSSMFGGSQTIGFKYFLGMQMNFCVGPIDRYEQIEAGDKLAWTGSVSANGSALILRQDLFGGDKREGGLVGLVDFMFGRDDQLENDYLAARIAGPQPGYRGTAGLVFRGANSLAETLPIVFGGHGAGGYVGTTPYVKPWAVTAVRILEGWSGGTAWYPEKATIGVDSMNAAHIVYQCITDPEWGQGSPAALIDDDNFREFADACFDEGMGLNMLWSRSTTIDQFLQIVMDHVAGILTFDVMTGKYRVRLIRGDYDPNILPTFDPSNARALTNYQKRSWGETVNELTIAYTDGSTGKATTIIVQDLGNIRAQEARIPDNIDRSGINDPDLIRVCAGRELASRSTPLSRGDMEVNRAVWPYGPGDVIKVVWPQHKLPLTVFRIVDMRKGNLERRTITVSLVEDIYALSGIEYAEQQPDAGDPIVPPQPEDSPDNGGTIISATQTAPPGSPTDGDRYIIASPATGAWAGHEGQLAEWDEDNDQWIFSNVPPGPLIFDQETGGHVVVDEYGNITPFTSGGSISIVDEDASPDEVIDPVSTIFVRGAQVDDMGTGGLRIVVTPATTKGDIATRSAVGGYERLPVGTEGQYLRARAGATPGLAWETPPPVGEAASGSRGYKNATQSIADSTLVALTWQVESFDTDAYHSTVSATSRFVAPTDGKYMAGASIVWDANTAGVRELYVAVNGTTATRIAGALQPASAGLVQGCAVPLNLVAGDYVEFYVRQNSGGARDVGAATEQVSTGWLTRIGITAAPTLMRGATWIRPNDAKIGVPVNDVQIRCPVKGTIVGAVIGTAGGPGSCVIDVWKDTHANYPPTLGDSITAAAKPTIAGGSKFEDTTLTGWNTAVAAGDWLFFHLESTSGFSAIFFELYIKETQ